MHLSVFVFLAVLALASCKIQKTLMRRSARVRREAIFEDNSNLQWKDFDGSLPNGAVSIYIAYVQRYDYVCKVGCRAGLYNPEFGPYCIYPYDKREYKNLEFELLINKDDFEMLEWKDGSYGSVPENSVRTCKNRVVYVGKNKYGLGKVVPRKGKNEAFFLPYMGKEYWYEHYQVLTINRDVTSQLLSDVKYTLNEAVISTSPPQTLQMSTIINNECQTVTKTMTLSRTMTEETRWNFGGGLLIGVTATVKGQIPLLVESSLVLRSEATFTVNRGITSVEQNTRTITLNLSTAPNHQCTVRMMGRQLTALVPYTARLTRTYLSGEVKWTSVTGTFDNTQVGDVRIVVDRCQPLTNAEPCHTQQPYG